MVHAAIDVGYLEKYDIKLETTVDKDVYQTPEHKYILGLEHKVIDELNEAYKKGKIAKPYDKKRKSYYSARSALMRNATSANPKDVVDDIYDIYPRNAIANPYLFLKGVFNSRNHEFEEKYGKKDKD